MLVLCEIKPIDAVLEVDDKRVPREPFVQCATPLVPGIHKVVVHDPSGKLPRYEDKKFLVAFGAKERPTIKVDLEDKLVELTVKSDRPVRLSVDGGQSVEGASARLRAGSHSIAIKSVSDSECFSATPVDKTLRVEQGRIWVDIKEAEPLTLPVTWTEASPGVLVVYPFVRVGSERVYVGDAQISIDDQIVTRTDGGTGYRIGCSKGVMRVSRSGFGEAQLNLKSNEARQAMRTGQPWQAELVQEWLTSRHVDCQEVTVAEFQEYLKDVGPNLNPNLLPRSDDKPSLNWNPKVRNDRLEFPVNAISFEGARHFCQWRGARQERPRSGRVAMYRDLLIAAGYDKSERRYPWGDSPDPTCERVHMKQYPDRDGCAQDTATLGIPQKVCAMPAESMGPYGHCDLLGNVAEWVGPMEVFGGGFRDDLATHRLEFSSPTYRPPAPKSDTVGFRCAWDLETGEICNCRERDHHH